MTAQAAAADDAELERLLETIFSTYHYDFRRYARASLRRRAEAALPRFHCDSLTALRAQMLVDPGVFGALLRFLTVQVSDLFRDPHYFRALREQVVPHLETYPHLKVWIAGCSTGEEAYSLAIVLREAGLLDRTQIYATDINPESLRIAEAGIYAVDRFARWSESYLAAGGRGSLSDYYTATSSGAMLDRTLRDAILFSDHSLATDAAFAEVQLVSCRNVLIYFDKDLQERALAVMRDALCRKGFLGLGTKESLHFSSHGPGFAELDANARIYRKL